MRATLPQRTALLPGCSDLAQEQEERWARHDGLASSLALLALVAAALPVGAHLSLPDMAMHLLLVRWAGQRSDSVGNWGLDAPHGFHLSLNSRQRPTANKLWCAGCLPPCRVVC